MTLKPLAGLIFALSALPALSAPWVELNDLNLRNDIQFLADTGIITVPVTTYPLMWNAIMPDVKAANTALLSDEQLTALYNVRQRFNHASSAPSNTKVNIYGATSAKRFTSFGLDDYDQGYIELSQEYIGTNFAGKIQANYRAGLDQNDGINVGNDFNLDGSYLAYKIGNWILTAGALDRWWGPGIDTSLIVSTNARPLPAVAITRDSSEAFETPWLSWLGTWTLTAQMAQLESDRAVPDTLMWSTRGTIRPLRGLEMGVSWSFQWAGEGQPGSFSDFFKILFGGQECANGDPTCDSELNTYQGNHLAGYDIRWSDTLFNTHYALYAQTIGEDGSPNGLITDKADLFGAELRFTAFGQRIMTNLEYTDTQVSCGGREDTSQNCFYEHGTYQSGYRFYRRAIGSTYDNDAQTFAFTVLSQLKSGNSWQAKFSKLKLNTNGLDRFPDDPNMGNTVSKAAEDLLQLDAQYKFIALESRFTTGIVVTQSTIDNRDTNSIDGYVEWEYRF